MASYNFVWPHSANEVYVTGTFDNWAKTEKLERSVNGFERLVSLPSATDKILYKFVVDGNWTTDHLAASEKDYSGNTNNVLFAESLLPAATAASSGLPGTFPETPFENSAEESNAFAVNPLPATAGAGNPIKLAPGEPVPSSTTFTSSTIDSNVKLDQESYEKSGSGAPQLPPILDNQAGASLFAVPALSGPVIPESSLPMGASVPSDSAGSFISSAAPGSTSANLAGQQPLEPRGVPFVVSDSQKEADAAPEASASTTAVQEKSQVEQELLDKVPEAPVTSESGTLGRSEGGLWGAGAAGLAAVGASAAGAAYVAKEKTLGSEPATTNGSAVPEVVTESEKIAGVTPEATASPVAVGEKSQVENELLSKVPEAPSTSESGVLGKSDKGYVEAAAGGVAAAGAAVVGAAYAAKEKAIGSESGNILPISTQDVDPFVSSQTATTDRVPEIVRESQQQANAAPEASASQTAVKEKSAVEKELEQKIKPVESAGEPAPTATASLSPIAPTTNHLTDRSRDVSPLTRPGEPSAAPTAPIPAIPTQAPATPKKDVKPATSAAPTPQSTKTAESASASPAPKSDKTKKRSLFGKLKDKLKS